MVKWLYELTDPRIWTVGFYDPDGLWIPVSDHPTPEEAAQRVHWLNGHDGDVEDDA